MDIRQLTEKEYLTVNAFIKNVMLTIFMSGNSDSAYASYIDSITNGEQLKNNINNGLWSVLGAYEGNEIIGACALDNEGTIIFLISNPKYNTSDIDSQLINYAKLYSLKKYSLNYVCLKNFPQYKVNELLNMGFVLNNNSLVLSIDSTTINRNEYRKISITKNNSDSKKINFKIPLIVAGILLLIVLLIFSLFKLLNSDNKIFAQIINNTKEDDDDDYDEDNDDDDDDEDEDNDDDDDEDDDDEDEDDDDDDDEDEDDDDDDDDEDDEQFNQNGDSSLDSLIFSVDDLCENIDNTSTDASSYHNDLVKEIDDLKGWKILDVEPDNNISSDLDYSIEKIYYSENNNVQDVKLNIPQIEYSDGRSADEVNKILAKYATKYLEINMNMMKGTGVKAITQEGKIYKNDLCYEVTYASNKWLNVVFFDDYNLGNSYIGRYGINSCLINLEEEKTYDISDIIEDNPRLAKKLHEDLIVENEDFSQCKGITPEIICETLQSTDYVDGRYSSSIAFNEEGPVYVFEYDYSDSNILIIGFEEIQYTFDDLEEYLKIDLED